MAREVLAIAGVKTTKPRRSAATASFAKPRDSHAAPAFLAGASAPAKNELEAALLAVSAVDGRYRRSTLGLRQYFSEYALIRYRVRVEIEWYLALAANPEFDALGPVPSTTADRLRAVARDFSLADAARVKELEAETNHDLKAVEYFLKERLAVETPTLPREIVHFALTSEDVNNLAYALCLKEFTANELMPRLDGLVGTLADFAHRYRQVAMLGRTHGQEASPTTVGKEFAVFAARLARQIEQLRRQEYLGKLNGAVGNFNAHLFACPEVDWVEVSRAFVEHFGLRWNPLTTQIESHDYMAEMFGVAARIATVLLDLARDMWGYVALGYFRQRVKAGEVGSSAMPHKVNPIDFENAEGNLGLAVALFHHLAAKLPVSRFQRDLSDSTVLRSLGTAFGHLTVALAALGRGLDRLEVNHERIGRDVDDDHAWEVLAEAIQTLMRRRGLDRPYERLKELTRGRAVGRRAIRQFIDTLPLDIADRRCLKSLRPRDYLGLAAELVERFAPPARPANPASNKDSRKKARHALRKVTSE